MTDLSRRTMLASLLALPAMSDEGWVPLFDGSTLNGWTPTAPGSFRVEGGCILADGPRAHLYYSGPVRGASFRNFELKADVKTQALCNSGIYFHTRFQPQGFPEKGFEVQVNNTALGEGKYRERKKTGSLYQIRNIYKSLARDGEWFQLHVSVRGKQVQVRLNGTLLVDWVEPDPPVLLSKRTGRVLDRGTFALQCHDPGSKAAFRNIMVRPLADDLPTPTSERPVVDAYYRDVIDLGSRNYPLVDYHAHLKGGLTLEELLARSRRLGIGYGIAVNCGVGFPTTNDAAINQYLAEMKNPPVFLAMQAEGREWVKMFSKEAVAKFDYVFTDAMTFSDDNGKRMRLWIKNEVGEIGDKQRFMEMCVNRITGILDREPIDIYVNPTYLPDALDPAYDELWTTSRMERVIEAAVRRDVAIEINDRRRIPHAPFIKLAKKAGAKFSFGTNNGGRDDLGRLEYCIAMVKECGLGWQDIFVPKPDGEKPVQKRGL